MPDEKFFILGTLYKEKREERAHCHSAIPIPHSAFRPPMLTNFDHLRRDYRVNTLLEEDVDPNPLVQFGRWFEAAVVSTASTRVSDVTSFSSPAKRKSLSMGRLRRTPRAETWETINE